MTMGKIVAYLFGTLAVLIALALLALATHAIYSGYVRGQRSRAAENETQIQREHLERDALRAYEQRATP